MSSNGEGALQWIVGLYQYDTTWDNPQHTKAHGDAAILAPTGLPAGSNPLGTNGAINGHLEGESYAAFGQIDWTFAEDWTFTLGARYTEDKKKGFDEAFYIGTHPVHRDRRGGSEPSRARSGSSSAEPGAGILCRSGDRG